MTETDDSDPAISPVVAVLLLLAVTVALAAGVFAFVLDVGGDGPTTSTASASLDQQGPEAVLQVTDMGTAETVVLESPLGTTYNISTVGATTTALALDSRGDFNVYGENGGKQTLVQSNPVSNGVSPDIVVAADGSGDYKTIQAGIDAADDGDLIAVKRATYTENVNVSTASVTLLAEPGTVIEDEHPNEDVIYIEEDGVSVQNFIVDGDPNPDDEHYARNCITVAADRATLVGNDLQNCHGPDSSTGAVIEVRGIQVTVLSSSISGGDLGLLVNDGADSLLLRGNHFSENSQNNIQNHDSSTVDAQFNDWDTDTPQESVSGPVDTYPERSYSGSTLNTASQYTVQSTDETSGSDTSTDTTSVQYVSYDDYEVSMDTDSTAADEGEAETNSPPVSEAGDSVQGVETEPIQFDASESYDPDGDEIDYAWDFNESGETDATGQSPTHTYKESGEYTAILTVTDSSGATDTHTVLADVAPKPEVNAGDDVTVRAGDELQFTANVESSSDDLSYEWRFGDGTTSGSSEPIHSYEAAGEYAVEVTVTNGHGESDTDTLTVHVEGVPESSLVAYWKFDDGNDMTTATSATGEYHGDLAPQSTYIAGVNETAFSASGHDGRANVTGIGDVLNEANAFTISGWYRTTNISDYRVAYGNRRYANGDKATFWFEPWRNGSSDLGVSGSFRDDAGTHHLFESDYYVEEDEWYHLTWAWDGRNATLYVDGEQVYHEDTGGLAVNLPSDHAIGSYGPESSNAYAGDIDELAVYSRALNQTEVQQIATSTRPPEGDGVPTANGGDDRTTRVGEQVAFDASDSTDTDGSIQSYEWDFTNDGTVDATGVTATHTYESEGNHAATLTVTDDTGHASTDIVTVTAEYAAPTASLRAYFPLDSMSGEAVDASGNGYDGTVTGVSRGGTGVSTNSFEFEGNSSNEVKAPSIDPEGEMTASVWVNWDGQYGADDVQMVLNEEQQYEVGINDGRDDMSEGTVTFAVSGQNEGWAWRDTGQTIDPGDWHHVVLVYDGTHSKLYLDDELVHTVERNIELGTDESPLLIGNRGLNNYSFSGRIDEVYVYNRALDDSEVTHLYKSAR